MQSLPGDRLPLELRQAVLRYLSERLEAPVISTAEAVRAVKKQVSGSATMSDRELADMIAETAIEAGFNINFDGTGTTQ